jgi:hypothetical protein
MKHLDIDESSQPAAVVFADIDRQNKLYWDNFTDEQHLKAQQLKSLAHAAYFRSIVKLNCRKEFIAIKVGHPQKADLLQNVSEFNDLNKFVQENNIEIVSTKTSLVFRIK